jgi:tRNA (guanine-1)-methyltransferase
VFPIGDLIYLSPDGSEDLETLSPEKVYVIGGFVDRSVNKVIVAIVLLSRTRALPGPANSEFRRGDCH